MLKHILKLVILFTLIHSYFNTQKHHNCIGYSLLQNYYEILNAHEKTKSLMYV